MTFTLVLLLDTLTKFKKTKPFFDILLDIGLLDDLAMLMLKLNAYMQTLSCSFSTCTSISGTVWGAVSLVASS